MPTAQGAAQGSYWVYTAGYVILTIHASLQNYMTCMGFVTFEPKVYIMLYIHEAY